MFSGEFFIIRQLEEMKEQNELKVEVIGHISDEMYRRFDNAESRQTRMKLWKDVQAEHDLYYCGDAVFIHKDTKEILEYVAVDQIAQYKMSQYDIHLRIEDDDETVLF